VEGGKQARVVIKAVECRRGIDRDDLWKLLNTQQRTSVFGAKRMIGTCRARGQTPTACNVMSLAG
jgi:hypothetical protein